VLDVKWVSSKAHSSNCLWVGGAVVAWEYDASEVSQCQCATWLVDEAASAEEARTAGEALLVKLEEVSASRPGSLEFFRVLAELDWELGMAYDELLEARGLSPDLLGRFREALLAGQELGRRCGGELLAAHVGGSWSGHLAYLGKRAGADSTPDWLTLVWAAWSPTRQLEVLVAPRGVLTGELRAVFEDLGDAGPYWQGVLEVADTLYVEASEGDPCFSVTGALAAAVALEEC
jgi:hypothetical protein